MKGSTAMGKPVKFTLKNKALNTDFGTVIFNGRFVFELNPKITNETWNEIGFIPLEGNRTKIESPDLFYYLNSRLPINLRNENPKKKLDYIKATGLSVASDSFILEPSKE